ncbi:MAG TPA: SpoIIE family protein phosphatase [Acidimicrobiales bacterium]|nr:SpoIIE family protein phosphatase [Acidimicrobiales bacterium]
MRSLPDWLPRGRTLPDDLWLARHRGVLALLWAHSAFIPVFAAVRGYSAMHAVVEGSIVPLTAVLATTGFGRRTRTAIASVGLLTSSAILVHLSGGMIEMHFHFFVMVAVVALYQDWIPFLAAIGYVLVHHGLMGAIDADSVFNHAAAQRHPWLWASIHAFFIAGISVACLVSWRLNERTLAERTEAEDRLREETHVVETLHDIGKALAADLDTERVIQAVTDAGTNLTGAAFGAFFYNVVGPEGEALMVYTLSGAPREAFADFPLPRKTEIFAPTFDGSDVVRLDDVTADPRFGKMGPHYGMPKGHLAVRSYLAVPVHSRSGEALGGLFFGHPDVGMFDEIHERIVVGIAAQAAVAVDNARLYESEHRARTTSELAQAGLVLLSDVSRALTASLEVEDILRDVAELVVATSADHCAIDVLDEAGGAHRVSAVAAGCSGASVDEMEAHTPDMTSEHDPVADAVRRRESLLVPGAQSTLVIPLVGRHEVLGAISLATLPSSGRSFSAADIPLAEEMARRVALAIENGRLYARQRTVAETLQHSLLPDRLPEIPGFEAAARYIAGADIEVGGDWYDVLQLPGGRIALTMGDVVGRGERAAALMGQLRTAVRAYALDGKSPSEVVGAVNHLLLDAGQEYMATMIYAVLDAEAGELQVVNAGHPPPLLVSDSGPSFIESAGGMPVGAMASARYRGTIVPVTGGATIVLYTDGLVEERAAPLAEGLERLRTAVADMSSAVDLEEMCSRVLAAARADHHAADDVALLAFRLCPVDAELHLRVPSEPSALAPLRATLRRWLLQAGANELETYELVVAVGEACSNAVRHATGPAHAHFELEASCNGSVEIRVRDEGRWRPHRPSEGGRGLSIIESFVDAMEVVPKDSGTEVLMRRRLVGEDAR